MNITKEAVDAAAEAMEDAALLLMGRDLGTVHRGAIARAALEAAAPHLVAYENALVRALAELADQWEAEDRVVANSQYYGLRLRSFLQKATK